MNGQRKLYIAIALIFIVSLVLSLAILVIESQTADPISGLPAELRGVLTLQNGKFQLHGGMNPDLMQKAIQYILAPRGGFDPYSHWEVSARDVRGTASWVYHDAKLPGVANQVPDMMG